jgi:alpha-tubulin suppressor-like RCC1 family protein
MNIIGSNTPKLIELFDETNQKIFIEKISCGRYYSLLLSREGDIYGFGNNDFGQLGNNNMEIHLRPTKIFFKKDLLKLHRIKVVVYRSHFLLMECFLYLGPLFERTRNYSKVNRI